MSEKKNWRDRSNDERDELVAFWSSPRGLIVAGIVGAGLLVFFVAGIVGAFL